MRRFILTGTPGSGKTTLIQALFAAGHSTVPEAATDVIAREQSRGNAEPWRSPDFIDRIIALQRRRVAVPDTATLQFHDRSPVCTYALCTFLGFAPSEALKKEMARIARAAVFQKRVFFIENLGFIEPTQARRISFEDALAFEQVHRQTYQNFGFECVSIAPAPVPARVKHMLSLI